MIHSSRLKINSGIIIKNSKKYKIKQWSNTRKIIQLALKKKTNLIE
jgi:hypothetical protein